MGKPKLKLLAAVAATAEFFTLGGSAVGQAPVQPLSAPQPRQVQAPPQPVKADPITTAAANDAEVRAIVEEVLKKRDEEAKKKAEEQKKKDEEKKKEEEARKVLEGTVVGSDNKLNVTFDNGGLRYKSADESFNIHVGGRLMSDFNFFRESSNLRQSPNVTSAQLQRFTGAGPGIGELQDGFFIRRARIVADGTFYQNFEFKTEFDLENYNNLAFDEMYLGVRNLPIVDTVRVGQMHVPFGLEAYTSSRWLPQMERSPVFDAFYQEFAPGIFVNRTFLDQRVTTQHMFHRIDNFNQFNGDSFGGGKFAYSGRVSALPIYEDEGRHLLHVAFDYQWRKGSVANDFNGGTALPAGSPPNAITSTSDIVRFRARQSLRDAIGNQGDGNRVLDTGNIFASHVNAINPELLLSWGQFWVQSEGTWAHVSDAFYPVPAAAAGTSPAIPVTATTRRGDLDYYGAYVQTGYFLTGENRGYDRRFGKADRVVPLENFFLVRGDNCRTQCGLGAWELTYRYSYVDLNSGSVLGGRYSEHTVGVNWYLTPNAKVQFNYLVGNRYAPSTRTKGDNDGVVQGFGLRTALEF